MKLLLTLACLASIFIPTYMNDVTLLHEAVTYYKADYQASFSGDYELPKNVKIKVHFCTEKEWLEACKQWGHNPKGVSAFILKFYPFRTMGYEIFIPKDGAWDKSVDEHSFGHEILHILKWKWHEGQKPRRRCEGASE